MSTSEIHEDARAASEARRREHQVRREAAEEERNAAREVHAAAASEALTKYQSARFAHTRSGYLAEALLAISAAMQLDVPGTQEHATPGWKATNATAISGQILQALAAEDGPASEALARNLPA